MKPVFFMKSVVLSVAILMVLNIGAVSAQNKKIDEAGLQFWSKFKTAIAKNDKEAIASMTQLPFMLENRELAKTAFIQKFDTIFNARVKSCFAKSTPLKEGDGFEVFCGKQIFLFGKVKGVYKFTEIGAND